MKYRVIATLLSLQVFLSLSANAVDMRYDFTFYLDGSDNRTGGYGTFGNKYTTVTLYGNTDDIQLFYPYSNQATYSLSGTAYISIADVWTGTLATSVFTSDNAARVSVSAFHANFNYQVPNYDLKTPVYYSGTGYTDQVMVNSFIWLWGIPQGSTVTFSATPVPEPSSILLGSVAVSLLGLMGYRRKRMHAA
jgi:hypothetical protein